MSECVCVCVCVSTPKPMCVSVCVQGSKYTMHESIYKHTESTFFFFFLKTTDVLQSSISLHSTYSHLHQKKTSFLATDESNLQ